MCVCCLSKTVRVHKENENQFLCMFSLQERKTYRARMMKTHQLIGIDEERMFDIIFEQQFRSVFETKKLDR
jgi:hypothetical protein